MPSSSPGAGSGCRRSSFLPLSCASRLSPSIRTARWTAAPCRSPSARATRRASWRPARPWRRRSPASGPRFSGSTGSAPRTTSSPWAAILFSRRRSSPGCRATSVWRSACARFSRSRPSPGWRRWSRASRSGGAIPSGWPACWRGCGTCRRTSWRSCCGRSGVSPADRTENALAALAALSLEQRAVLERLLDRERAAAEGNVGDGGDGQGADLAPIAPRADRAAFPLSFSQQRLWFLDQLSPGDAAYNIHGAVRLRGALAIAALARSLRAVASRHEVLRSRFAAVEGRPEQSLAPPGGPPLPVVDLEGLNGLNGGLNNQRADRREAEVLRLALEEARRPFDLARGPLLRTALLRLDRGESVLLVTMHHIVSDGWSVGVFIRELAALYAGFAAPLSTGLGVPLPPLPLQYADFAAWQRQRLAGGRLAREVEHWRCRLAGVAELRLPVEPSRARPAGSVPVAIPVRLAERLKEIARGSGASLFMILLAAFEAVLLRWSGQRDFAVGTPIANRNRPEIEGLIGFFVNTLVLRASLAGDPPFHALLERVRDVCLDAYAHQDLPFEKLVEELQPERRLGRNPLFSALLALQNAPQVPLGLPGLALDL